MAKGSGKKNDAVEKAGNKSPAGRGVASATPRKKAGTRKGLPGTTPAVGGELRGHELSAGEQRSMKWSLSVGEIASQFGVSVSRVQYVLRTRGFVRDKIVGNLRFFTPATVRRIGRELAAIVKDRAFGHAARDACEAAQRATGC